MSIFRGKKIFLLKSALALLLFVSLVMPVGKVVAAGLLQTVKQGGLDTIGQNAYGEPGGKPTKSVTGIVVGIIKIFLGFLGLIFVILIITAGFKWMASQGDAAKITSAKGQLQASIIGLVIILMAYSITIYVVDCTLQVTGAGGNSTFCPGSGAPAK